MFFFLSIKPISPLCEFVRAQQWQQNKTCFYFFFFLPLKQNKRFSLSFLLEHAQLTLFFS